MKRLAQSLVLVALTAGTLGLTGCTDDEIGASAVVIGAAVIASHGGGCYGCGWHGGWHGGGRRWDTTTSVPAVFGGTEQAATVTPAFVSSDARVQAVAANYGISDYAATYIVRAIVLAQSKDLSGVKDLGLDQNDFEALYAGQELQASKVDALAAKLLMSTEDTQALLAHMSSDIEAQRAK